MNLFKLLLVTFLVVTALAACAGVQIQVVQETPSAASSPATQTTQEAAETTGSSHAETPTSTVVAALSDASTATPTTTATPTRTPTSTAAAETTDEPDSTATVRPTRTPTRANTPTPTAAPTREIKRLNLPGPALQSEDMPEGFEEIDLIDMGLTEESLAASPFAVQSVFAFVQPETGEVILGGAVWLATIFDQFGFDVLLSSPDLLTDLVIENVGEVEILEQEVLTLNRVGDNSGGFSFLAEAEGTLVRIDVVGFRKGNYGAFVSLAYLEEEGTALSIEEAAQDLAAKIQ